MCRITNIFLYFHRPNLKQFRICRRQYNLYSIQHQPTGPLMGNKKKWDDGRDSSCNMRIDQWGAEKLNNKCYDKWGGKTCSDHPEWTTFRTIDKHVTHSEVEDAEIATSASLVSQKTRNRRHLRRYEHYFIHRTDPFPTFELRTRGINWSRRNVKCKLSYQSIWPKTPLKGLLLVKVNWLLDVERFV